MDLILGDLDELLMDVDSIFILTVAEQSRRAKTLVISLMVKVLKKSGDPGYVKLGERLEKLRK